MLEDKRCRNPDCRQEMHTDVSPPGGSGHWYCENPECGWHADRVVNPKNRPKVQTGKQEGFQHISTFVDDFLIDVGSQKAGDLWKRNDLAEPRKVEKIEPIEPTEDGPWWVFSSPIPSH